MSPQESIAHYRIVSKIGEGGMGAVYRARDQKLNRDVAIKILPDSFAADPDRMARFEREAQVLAALNHPNIAHIYGVEDRALILELVEGETLAERIARGPIGTEETLALLDQLIDAMEHAHDHGVVHRDLKPSNIKITPGAHLKVLDFGLAKALSTAAPAAGSNPANSPTITMRATQAGIIVGTAAYMSPEQARGQEVDRRTDIWAFGVIVYEMLTGHRLFDAPTVSDILAAVLTREPDWSAVPPGFRRLLRLCLARDGRQRLSHISAARVLVDDLKNQAESGRATNRSRRRWTPAVFALVGAIAGGLAVGYAMRSRPAGAKIVSVSRITADTGLSETPAISPNGDLVAFASDRSGEGNLDIWVRQVSGGEPIRITHHPAHDLEPRFSPDGSRIAFHSDRDGGGIYLVSALGGEERLLVRGGITPRFSPDGKWISYLEGGEGGAAGLRFIKVIAVSGGKPIAIRSDLGGLLSGIWSPDSRSLLLSGRDTRRGVTEWCLVGVASGETRCLDAAPALQAAGLLQSVAHEWAGGYVYLTARSGDTLGIWRISLAADDKHVTGKPEKLTTGVGEESDPSVAIRPDGTVVIAFSIRNENRDIWVLPLGPGGAASGSGTQLTTSLLADHFPYASRDGRWLAYLSGPTLRLKDLKDGKDRLLLEDGSFARDNSNRGIALSPDGTRVAFSIGPSLASVSLADNAREALLERSLRAEAWTRDQRWLVLQGTGSGQIDLHVLDVASRKATVILAHPGWGLHSARLSPDERWVSFHATVTPDTRRIFIAPFRGAEAVPDKEWIPITDGRNLDREPRWSPDGKLIYFLSDRDGFRCVWAQAVDTANRLVKGAPFAVYHAHSTRPTLNLGNDTGPSGLTIVPGKMIVTMAENTGNIWLASSR